MKALHGPKGLVPHFPIAHSIQSLVCLVGYNVSAENDAALEWKSLRVLEMAYKAPFWHDTVLLSCSV